jgi:hypothetical protein
MSIDLYKVSEVSWVVCFKDEELISFETLDDAADYLEDKGIAAEQVDNAIMDIMMNNSSHALFGEQEGVFIYSDEELLDEKIGVA